MSIAIIQDAIELGIIFSIMSFGVFLSFRVLNIPDLTVDGSFTTGCAVSAVCCMMGHPFLGIIFAFLAGGLAGMVTGWLMTKCKIQPLLAGILTMTALYSINLKIMSGQPNISIFGKTTIFTPLKEVLPVYAKGIVVTLLAILLVIILYSFLKSQLGMSIRATGDNEAMVRASSINSNCMKLIGIALANAIVAFAGGIFTQYQNFADISGGVGMMVVGLASIIVGEAFIRNSKILYQLVAVIVGAICYRLLLTFALQFGVKASDLNLLSTILVVVAISLPQLRRKNRRKQNA